MVGRGAALRPLSRDPDLPTTGHAQDREGSAVGVGSLSRLRPARAPGSAGARRDPREEPHRVRRRLGVGRRRRHPERHGRHHARRRDRSGHEGLSLLGRDQHQRDDRDQRELGHRHLPGRHLDQLLGGRHQLGLVADVTPYVTGDGTYSLTELVQPSAFGANGASLVVLFDGGNPANNRDLIFYEGDDSTSIEATPVVEDRGPLQQLVLQGDLPGRAQITARSAGGGLSLPLPLAPPVLVRLRARNGLCWGGNYSVPARNGRRRFSSRGDFYYPHAPAR